MPSPTKNDRIRQAALKSGPKFSTAHLYITLEKSIPMLELGARLARSDFVTADKYDASSRSRMWVLVDGERHDH